MGRRRGLLAALLVLVLLASGCKVDATVDVEVESDGTGEVKLTVVLDDEAAALAAAGGSLEERILLQDVRDAGWEVGEWTQHDDGGAQISFTKGFSGEEGLAAVLNELDGGAYFRDVEIVRRRGLIRSSDELRLEVDLSAIGSGIAGDPLLSERLTGSGIDVAALDAALSQRLAEAFTVSVRLTSRDEREVVRVVPGQQVTAEVTGTGLEWDRIIWLGLGVVSAFLAGIVVFATVMGRRRRRRRRAPAKRPVPTW